ncbi:MAG: tryptophan synthase subunit beta [Acidobacteria bacterium 21-70-11]|nr:MAG: tryptophan synthase subunit beta [Acidobacteria bacterium 21-70-11]HQT95984.1 tryptophan synthase subunit beta [Thermoanaerobaculaceae bacterium]
MKPVPDSRGYFGPYGGRFVPETLMAPLAELTAAWQEARRDRAFRRELAGLLATYCGRPTPISRAARLTQHLGGAQVFLKREDLCHTGAHKINNAVGQCLLARRMGKVRVIAETGAGQHGVAVATAAALFGLRCRVYMGTEDERRQALNVYRMKLLGAEVVGVDAGARTLKDAINESLRDWVTNVATTHYVLGSVLGPHPYPLMVREFQSVIGSEALLQIRSQHRALPDLVVACVGGGSNAAGIFSAFVPHRQVELVGVEAGGRGTRLGEHAARFAGGHPGVLHGTRSYVLQDQDGQVVPTHSVSAGLDYPAVGPEHAFWHDSRRVSYVRVEDREALDAFHLLSELEGIVPALETAHAVAYVARVAPRMGSGQAVLVNLSGRGDKDVVEVARLEGVKL